MREFLETVKNIILVSNDLVIKRFRGKVQCKNVIIANFLIFVARLLLLSHSPVLIPFGEKKKKLNWTGLKTVVTKLSRTSNFIGSCWHEALLF